MARDDQDDWKRRREREDERDAQEEEEKRRKSGGFENQKSSSSGKPGASGLDAVVTKQDSDKVSDLLLRAEPMIEQLNNLYRMYAVGVDSIPPHERRKQLDTLMLSLEMTPKLTATLLFKYNSIASRYRTYKEKWDKMMKDIESGKVKRQSKS